MSGHGRVRLAVLGAAGRMGVSLVRAIAAEPAFELVGALGAPGSPTLGADAGEVAGVDRRFGVALSSDRATVLERAEVALDFSLPAAAVSNLEACRERGIALLLGTTGLGPDASPALAQAQQRIALLLAANTSLGVAILADLVERAARALPESYDIDILDAHHRDKRDAPSGTALVLGAAAARGRGRPFEPGEARGAAGRAGGIGFASLRTGEVVGEHTVYFSGPGERLELTHRATDRATFAWGALKAAAWLKGRAPGRYSMADVLLG